MEMRCTPSVLEGKIKAIPSKADAHRLLICAFLSKTETVIECGCFSKDISATVGALRSMGAQITETENRITVNCERVNETAKIDCIESGSTLRFLLPVISALGINAEITGQGRLPQRPVSPLKEEMEAHGAVFENGSQFPLKLSGKLTSGEYTLKGNVSSQFVSGLLFALPLLSGDSVINLIPPLESVPYINMTISALKRFGVEVLWEGNSIKIKGSQSYASPKSLKVEGDWSNSSFFLCAGAVSKNGVTVTGLDINSPQGDKEIINILKKIGADVEVTDAGITVKANRLTGLCVDGSDIPDAVPITAALAAMCQKGVTHFVNSARLRLKESDRIKSVCEMLTAVGAAASETDDGLVVWSDNQLIGGRVEGHNDHRIVMSAAILSCGCALPIDIIGAEAVEKSYPDFFKDFNSLGGKADVINDGK